MTFFRVRVKPEAICFGFFILLLSACGEADPPSKADTHVMFAVDSTQISAGDRYADFNVIFHAPKNWYRQSDDVVEQIRKQLPVTSDSAAFKVNPKAIYIQPEAQCIATLSSFSLAGELRTADDFLTAIKPYDHFVDTLYADMKPSRTDYEVNGFTIRQYRIISDQMVNFKLLCYHPAAKLVQIDYMIPRHAPATETMKLESSIGSLKALLNI